MHTLVVFQPFERWDWKSVTTDQVLSLPELNNRIQTKIWAQRNFAESMWNLPTCSCMTIDPALVVYTAIAKFLCASFHLLLLHPFRFTRVFGPRSNTVKLSWVNELKAVLLLSLSKLNEDSRHFSWQDLFWCQSILWNSSYATILLHALHSTITTKTLFEKCLYRAANKCRM